MFVFLNNVVMATPERQPMMKKLLDACASQGWIQVSRSWTLGGWEQMT